MRHSPVRCSPALFVRPVWHSAGAHQSLLPARPARRWPAEYVRRYATEEALAPIEADGADAASSSDASESSMSDFSEDEARDMEL